MSRNQQPPVSKELDDHEKTVILESVKRFYIENRISKVTFDSIKQKLK